MQLTRADVEWLLYTLDGGLGPIDWSAPGQRTRPGLDLRGARLTDVDLSNLPLAGMCGGISPEQWHEHGGGDPFEPNLARERLRLDLSGASLVGAHLEGANLNYALLFGANLDGAVLDGASLRFTRFDAQVESNRVVQHAASLARVSARQTTFASAWMQGVALDDANLVGADLRGARLEATSLRRSNLAGADLRDAVLDEFTNVDGALLGDGTAFVALGGSRLIGVDLTSVPWTVVTRLGDEVVAHTKTTLEGKRKSRNEQLTEFALAARTYRQLSQMLRRQGMAGPAGEFSYRAQTVQRELTIRRVLWQGRVQLLGGYLFSLFLAVLTGYGYRLGRILRAYALVVTLFASAYVLLGLVHGPRLQWYEALFVSLTAFHGRVFAEVFLPGSPQIWVTAAEAVCGLLVESVFIAMLTRRFFGSD